jgi:uncharacterized protein GlcG (DUF336 family)
MRFTFGIIAALAGALTAESAAAQAPVQRSVSFALALEAAQSALATCAARGWPVTAVVLDAYGEEQVVLRADRPYTVNDTDQARRKAYTALSGQPSAAMMKLMDTDPNAYARQAYVNPRITPQAGGLPIKIGGVTVAALGVSGAGVSPGVRGGLNDEACAAAGIAKIQDRLR